MSFKTYEAPFKDFAIPGLLGALIYYGWTEKPGKPDSWAIFRCGGLTEAGKFARALCNRALYEVQGISKTESKFVDSSRQHCSRMSLQVSASGLVNPV